MDPILQVTVSEELRSDIEKWINENIPSAHFDEQACVVRYFQAVEPKPSFFSVVIPEQYQGYGLDEKFPTYENTMVLIRYLPTKKIFDQMFDRAELVELQIWCEAEADRRVGTISPH